jgi:hypothetical protein
MYLLSLGEFSTDGQDKGHDVLHTWIMFVLASVILMLLLLNFIITIMGEPFEMVKENEAVYRYS